MLADINKLEERTELYNSKSFKKEVEKISIFQHLNVEKPTKWFLNLTSDKMSQDSPSTKLTNTERKYKRFNDNKQEWGIWWIVTSASITETLDKIEVADVMDLSGNTSLLGTYSTSWRPIGPGWHPAGQSDQDASDWLGISQPETWIWVGCKGW